ncbi:MAG: histidine kinase dimerization/phospho-acceptor domain-containing protein, partial [Bacteroidota bacterium]
MKCANIKLREILKEHFPETGVPEICEEMIQEIDQEMCKYDRHLSDLEEDGLLQQLEDANENLREFAHIVSHDLKAPLRGIRSIGKWLKMDYEEKLDEEGKELLLLLDQRTARMQQLIDGIMNFARVSHATEQPIFIQISPFLEDLISALEVPAHIHIHIQKDLPGIEF